MKIEERFYSPEKGYNDFYELWEMERPYLSLEEHKSIIQNLYFWVIFGKNQSTICEVKIDGVVKHKYEIEWIFDDFVTLFIDNKLIRFMNVNKESIYY